MFRAGRSSVRLIIRAVVSAGLVWALLAAIPTAAPAASAPGGPVALTVGYSPGGVTIAPVFVARAQGFFARQGLNVSLEPVRATVTLAALERGELQFSSVGGPELVNAALAGASVVMVATGCDYPAFSLYVAKRITRMRDLAGKTIAVTAAGTATETAAKLFLVHFGMLGQVRIIPAGGTVAGVFAALENGLVAGGIFSVPLTTQAAQAGFVELLNGIHLGLPLTLSGLVVTRPYLKEHRDVVERFLRAYRDGWTFMAAPANEPAVVAILASFLKVSPEVARAAYEYLYPVWAGKKIPTVDPRGIANSLRFSPHPDARTASPAAFIDNSIIESVK